jgi:hypothetical protein
MLEPSYTGESGLVSILFVWKRYRNGKISPLEQSAGNPVENAFFATFWFDIFRESTLLQLLCEQKSRKGAPAKGGWKTKHSNNGLSWEETSQTACFSRELPRDCMRY